VPIVFQERITREEVRTHRDRVYVFGDNLEKRGLGGLARECRGEPNAIGVPTKREPSMAPGAFFTKSEEDYYAWVKAARPSWELIVQAIRERKTVVFPKAGLGTGLAELPKRAPRIARTIQSWMQALQEHESRLQSDAHYRRTIVRKR
jgi:hypothetical protein